LNITGGASGSGNGTISFTVAANTGGARNGTLTVAGQTFTVNQGAVACAYSLNPTSTSISATGGPGSFNVASGTGCAWTATANAAWLTISGGASGSGNGTVSFTVAANTSGARSGTLTVAGQTFAVNQAAAPCDYSINGGVTAFNAAGGSGSFNVSTGAGCTWTASSSASWLTVVSGASGTGNGSVGYSVSPNTGAARTATITVGGQTFTVTQAALACIYSINPTSVTLPSNAGTGTVSVTTSTGCAWTATSNAGFLTITGGSSGSGSGSVNYSINRHNGKNDRTGTLTIAGQTFTVVQRGD
jgi:hypothetical protein